MWQVVDAVVEAFVKMDEFLEKVLKEHEETFDPREVRDFVDIYIKTRSESEDKHLYTGNWRFSKYHTTPPPTRTLIFIAVALIVVVVLLALIVVAVLLLLSLLATTVVHC